MEATISEAKTVAFVGVGTMGCGMIQNLLRAGFHVRAFNRGGVPENLSRLSGMFIAGSVAEAFSAADIGICCLADDAAIEALLLKRSDLIFTNIPSGFLLIDCGTTSLEMTARLSKLLGRYTGSFLDAPVTGSKNGAEGGTLTFMVGGTSKDLNRAMPLFRAMGKHIAHVGEQCGLGQAAKYCLNMQQSVVLQATIEAYGLAHKLGVPLEKMSEIIEHSAGKSGVGSFKTPTILAGDFRPHFKLSLMHKDLKFADSQAQRLETQVPAAKAVMKVFDQAMKQLGWSEQDFSVIARLMNGVVQSSADKADDESSVDS